MKSPNETEEKGNSVRQTNGYFPFRESNFQRRRRRGCSGGSPGLLSSIHQPIHPPGSTRGTVYGGSSATLGLSPQDSKEMAALGGGGGEEEGTRAKMVQSFLVSIFTLSIYSHSTALCACVCFFAAWLSWDPADVSVVWIPERRCRYGEADWHISTLFSYFPSHSFSLPLSYRLGSCQWLSYTRYSSVIIKVEGSLTLQCPQVFCFFYAEECTQTQRKVEMRTQISLKAF